MVCNRFFAIREQSKVKNDFFVDLTFLPMQHGVRNIEIFKTFEKKISKFFEVLNWSEMDFAQ